MSIESSHEDNDVVRNQELLMTESDREVIVKIIEKYYPTLYYFYSVPDKAVEDVFRQYQRNICRRLGNEEECEIRKFILGELETRVQH